MAIRTDVQTQYIEAQIQDQFALRVLPEKMWGPAMMRDLTGAFNLGDEIRTPTIGERAVQNLSKNDTQISPSPISTGAVTLTITDFVGDSWYIEDTMRQDGTNIPQLLQANAEESTRAFAKFHESDSYSVLNGGQTASNNNAENGLAHRLAASGASSEIEIADIFDMRLAFDKADVSEMGRVAIVDPVVAATMLKKFQGTYNVDSNQVFQPVLEDSFVKNHQFVMNIAGFHIFQSNLLPVLTAAETGLDTDAAGTASIGDIANIFMCVADDNQKPLMGAVRQQMQTEFDRNIFEKRDYFTSSFRYGLKVQRKESLGVIITSPTATS